LEVALNLPEVATREEWLVARKQLLAREKELTRQHDVLNAERRRLPMVRIDKDYSFEGPDGPATLPDLFDGCSQLIVRHAMFDPEWERACPVCTAAMDATSPALLAQLRSRDTAYVAISRAHYSKLAEYRSEHGWTFPWYSSFGSDFNYDFGVTLDPAVAPVTFNYRSHRELIALDPAWADDASGEVGGFSCFLRAEDAVFHTYSTYARGGEQVDLGVYAHLDITALGRQEDWEEPKGRATDARPAGPIFS
jgi:predicted dithiol-disulfide oxidoreductase (DUF899 family)